MFILVPPTGTMVDVGDEITYDWDLLEFLAV